MKSEPFKIAKIGWLGWQQRGPRVRFGVSKLLDTVSITFFLSIYFHSKPPPKSKPNRVALCQRRPWLRIKPTGQFLESHFLELYFSSLNYFFIWPARQKNTGRSVGWKLTRRRVECHSKARVTYALFGLFYTSQFAIRKKKGKKMLIFLTKLQGLFYYYYFLDSWPFVAILVVKIIIWENFFSHKIDKIILAPMNVLYPIVSYFDCLR